MNPKEYSEYLKRLEKTYRKFINVAKQIKPSDKSPTMKSLKSRSIILNIELRTILKKFRGKSCGCPKK